MKTITFYSYKGGVGRSLLLANTAKRLIEIGKNVCLLDFDLEAPGLEFKFWDYESDEKEKGVVDFITSYTEDGVLPDDILLYTSDIKIASRKHHGWLKLIKAGEIDDDGSYWKKLMSIDWKKLFYNGKAEGYELILHLKALIENQVKPDFLLVDSRTGITETSGITLSILAEEVVVIAANNDENIIGSEIIIKSILSNTIGVPPKVHFVLSRVPYTEDTEDREEEFDKISELKLDFTTDDITIDEIYLIHSDRDLEKEETLKIGELEKEGKICIENDYLHFFDGVIKPNLTIEDIRIFEKIVTAKKLLQDALDTNDIQIQLKVLNESIKLDNENARSYLERARINRINGKLDEAENDFLNHYKYEFNKKYINYWNVINFYFTAKLFSKLIEFAGKHPISEINSTSKAFKTNCERLIGKAYIRLGRYTEAFNYINELIQSSPDNPSLNFDMAELYLTSKNIEKAEEYIDIAIKIKPSFPDALYIKALILSKQDAKENVFFYLNRTLDSLESSKNVLPRTKNIIKNKIATEPEFKKYYTEEAFQRILYKYNIRLKTEG